MNEIEELKARVSTLEGEVKRLEETIEQVAQMISRHGIKAYEPDEDEVPLLDRVEDLEREVFGDQNT